MQQEHIPQQSKTIRWIVKHALTALLATHATHGTHAHAFEQVVLLRAAEYRGEVEVGETDKLLTALGIALNADASEVSEPGEQDVFIETLL